MLGALSLAKPPLMQQQVGPRRVRCAQILAVRPKLALPRHGCHLCRGRRDRRDGHRVVVHDHEPLTPQQIEQLVEALPQNRDGLINYKAFMRAFEVIDLFQFSA